MSLKLMAISRLVLDNFDPHESVLDYAELGTAQTTWLSYGADDIDGTVHFMS